MFFITFKVFVMFVTFVLFQSNLFVVLARGKGPKNSVHRDLFKTKSSTQKNSQPPSCILRALRRVDRPSTQLIFPNASKMSSS